MKILMVNKFLHPNGGSETYIHQIGQYLIEIGHEVQYFGMNHPDRIVGNQVGAYTGEVNFRGGGKLPNPFAIIYSREAYQKIMTVLRNFAPDIIHVNNFNFQLTPSILYAIKKYEKQSGKRTPIIATAHDYQWICPNHMLKIPESGDLCFQCEKGRFINCTKNKCIHNSTVKSFMGSLEGYYYKMRRTYRFFDVVICPSEFMNEKLSSNPEMQGKTVTLHNFAQCTLKCLENEENFEDAENPEIITGIKTEKKDYVLYFGRMAQEKGIDIMLKVCEELKDIPFVFAGNGPLTQEVKRIQNIKYAGFLEGKQLAETISQARFTLFPSTWYENCPFSLIETQSYGTPVIARNLGGVGELVTHGKTGILVEDNKIDTWVNAIGNMWKNKEKCNEFANNCKNTHFYTLDKYCDILLGIYRKEIEGN